MKMYNLIMGISKIHLNKVVMLILLFHKFSSLVKMANLDDFCQLLNIQGVPKKLPTLKLE